MKNSNVEKLKFYSKRSNYTWFLSKEIQYKQFEKQLSRKEIMKRINKLKLDWEDKYAYSQYILGKKEILYPYYVLKKLMKRTFPPRQDQSKWMKNGLCTAKKKQNKTQTSWKSKFPWSCAANQAELERGAPIINYKSFNG